MDELELLIDLHLRNDRQGPGSPDATRRAIELAGLDASVPVRIADLGCGTGASTLVLARELDAQIAAVDAAPAFVARLRERAEAAGLADRIDARVGDMAALPFDDAAFDVVWSESAIYSVGFETGLQAWRRFVRPGGVLIVSELTWTTSQRPADVTAHWLAEYPGITTVSANIDTIERTGFVPTGFFFIPPTCWTEHYYAPLRAAFPTFLERHAHDETARRIIDAEQAEMDLYAACGQWYGYAFYAARRPVDDGVPGAP